VRKGVGTKGRSLSLGPFGSRGFLRPFSNYPFSDGAQQVHGLRSTPCLEAEEFKGGMR